MRSCDVRLQLARQIKRYIKACTARQEGWRTSFVWQCCERLCRPAAYIVVRDLPNTCTITFECSFLAFEESFAHGEQYSWPPLPMMKSFRYVP